MAVRKPVRRGGALTALLFLTAQSPTTADVRNWQPVADALGKSGAQMPGGIYRVGLPRSDLHVSLDGIALRPTFALGSWLAFAPMSDRAMVMGDLVLTETEIGPVMQKLQAGGIEVTALHNHLLRARPATFYMHVFAEGDPVKIARALHEAIVLSRTPLGQAPAPAAAANLSLDTGAVDRALGTTGKIASGVYQVAIKRAQLPKEHGIELPAALGSAEAINFQPTGKNQAAITGDFVLVASEVSPVMRALRSNGIEVTALHNHMLDEQPRLFFMHFWAHGELPKLLTGLRAALDHVAVQKMSR